MSNVFNNSRIPINERISDPLEYLSNFAHQYLPLNDWGFSESYRSFTLLPEITYDSSQCRVRIHMTIWEPDSGYSAYFTYGRLHACNEQDTMFLDGEEYRCWHQKTGGGKLLAFIDDVPPEVAANSRYVPEKIREIREKTWWKMNLGKLRTPDLAFRMEAEIWDYYGKKIFELLDLQNPKLWCKYQDYMKRVFDIKGRNPIIKPPLDKIC